MERFAVVVTGPDGPGALAAVTGALFEQGAQLEHATVVARRGRLVLDARVVVPATASLTTDHALAEALREALAVPATAFDLAVDVRPERSRPASDDAAGAPPSGDVVATVDCRVRITGAPSAGLVHHVAAAIAEHGALVVALDAEVPTGDAPAVLLADVRVDAGREPALRDALARLGPALQVELVTRGRAGTTP